jgi:UDP-3-O-acyl N-acetylglucosamine deacetylase
MPSRSQQTIRRPASVTGAGYWSGRECRVEFLPAPAGAGVVFVRADRDVPVRIAATVENRVDAVNRTNLAAAGVQVQMVEHALSALAGLGVDCCVVRVTAEELPGLDGSSRAYVEAIDAAGLECLGAPVEPLVADGVWRVGDDSSWIEVSPPKFAGLSVEYELDYGPGPIGRQSLVVRVSPEVYRADLAAARTFISVEDARRLRASGLALGVTTQDLVVFDAEGPVDNVLRWRDECVRHKVLDLVGDLALAGRPVHAHVRACRSGHRLNAAVAARLLAGQRRRASA